jgi:hypothetical protein
MQRFLILACSATKRPTAGLCPALERYDGPAYRVLRAWLRMQPTAGVHLTVCIISAAYGWLAADTPIPDYNQRMTAARALALRADVRVALLETVADDGPFDATLIMLGAAYRAAVPLDPATSACLGTLTWTQGGIGQQLGQLKRWLATP